jgi:hypothetical protein
MNTHPKTGFIAKDWKAYQKNTLCGFVTIETPSGLVFKEVAVHQRESQRWISLPSKPYPKNDGSTGYASLIEFKSPETRNAFQTHALAAIDAMLDQLTEESQ